MNRSVLVLVIGLLLPGLADAQVRITRSFGGGNAATRLLEEQPGGFGVAAWRVGQWARYSITQNVGAPMPVGQFRTVSIVGQRGEQFWVESQDEFTGMVQSAGMVRKSLLPFGAIAPRVGTETYVLAPDSSVQRVTLLRAASGGGTRDVFPSGWTRAGEESLTTPAGTFRAVKWRKGADELWTSSEAGPVGVVRFRSSEFEIELVARGASGASSRVPYGGND